MLGIIFGTLCLLALVVVWRRRFHPGCGYGGPHRWGRRRHGGMYRLFEELDTSPGQEKAIRSALKELWAALGGLRPQLKQVREGVATALGGEAFDAPALERALEGHLSGLAGVSRTVTAALGKIHEVLDADQRRRLARLIESLPYGPAF